MIHACTIATRHYMAHMRVLVQSLLAQSPESRITVLVADDATASGVPDDPRVEALVPLDIGIEDAELHRRATMFMAQGFATSLKPNLLLALLERGDGPILFIDADGCIYDDLSSLGELCEAHSLLLSPHTLAPYPPGYEEESAEQVILRAGTINSGFVGVGRGAEPAVRWWAQRTARRCIFEPRLAIMFDQTWLTLAPCLFEHAILRDPGCNVAGWNLHTRDVEWDGDTPRIDGGRLRHFHFAGSFNPEHPETITPIESIARWWTGLAERPGAARLVRQYAQRLIDSGYRETRSSPPRYDTAPDGTPIEPWMRESYRHALLEAEQRGEAEPPNPFSHGSDRFQEWLRDRAAQAVAAGGDRIAESVSTDALQDALLNGQRMLSRIAELEGIRDEAVAWAERESAHQRQTAHRMGDLTRLLGDIEDDRDRTAAERDRHAQTLQRMSSSASWRLTRPLRSVKSALGGDGGA